jgi:ankyrin repeat protein
VVCRDVDLLAQSCRPGEATPLRARCLARHAAVADLCDEMGPARAGNSHDMPAGLTATVAKGTPGQVLALLEARYYGSPLRRLLTYFKDSLPPLARFRDERGEALHLAIRHGRQDVAAALVERSPAIARQHDRHGNDALTLAAQRREVGIVTLLLAADVEPRDTITRRKVEDVLECAVRVTLIRTTPAHDVDPDASVTGHRAAAPEGRPEHANESIDKLVDALTDLLIDAGMARSDTVRYRVSLQRLRAALGRIDGNDATSAERDRMIERAWKDTEALLAAPKPHYWELSAREQEVRGLLEGLIKDAAAWLPGAAKDAAH